MRFFQGARDVVEKGCPGQSFSIMGGEAFQKRMLQPLNTAAIALLAESGWREDRVLRLTAEAASRGATFVLWPESSVPFYFQASPVKAAPIREAARRLRVSLLIGGDEMEAAPKSMYAGPKEEWSIQQS